MKKVLNLKTLIVAFVLVLTFAFVAGCSQPKSASDASGDSSADASADSGATTTAASFDESAYPNHASATEGIASKHSSCSDCHDDSLTQQIAEAGIEGEPELSSLFYVDTEKCQSCHGDSETLAKKTESLGDYNPHASIHGTIEYCNECHKGHSEQKDICGECHPNGGQEMKG